ncbi:MAG: hypothetical protein ABJL99_20435 [Aliishimia sp.]
MMVSKVRSGKTVALATAVSIGLGAWSGAHDPAQILPVDGMHPHAAMAIDTTASNMSVF